MKANSKQDQLISAGKGKVKTLNGSDLLYRTMQWNLILKSCPYMYILLYDILFIHSLLRKLILPLNQIAKGCL